MVLFFLENIMTINTTLVTAIGQIFSSATVSLLPAHSNHKIDEAGKIIELVNGAVYENGQHAFDVAALNSDVACAKSTWAGQTGIVVLSNNNDYYFCTPSTRFYIGSSNNNGQVPVVVPDGVGIMSSDGMNIFLSTMYAGRHYLTHHVHDKDSTPSNLGFGSLDGAMGTTYYDLASSRNGKPLHEIMASTSHDGMTTQEQTVLSYLGGKPTFLDGDGNGTMDVLYHARNGDWKLALIDEDAGVQTVKLAGNTASITVDGNHILGSEYGVDYIAQISHSTSGYATTVATNWQTLSSFTGGLINHISELAFPAYGEAGGVQLLGLVHVEAIGGVVI